jgi:hypothetical protein
MRIWCIKIGNVLVLHYYYTDSKVVLRYLSNEVHRFYVYVTNRVNRIRAASSPTPGYIVLTDNNPAGIATRHINADQLINSTYLTGPEFLRSDSQIPLGDFQLVNPHDDREFLQEILVNKVKVVKHRTLP